MNPTRGVFNDSEIESLLGGIKTIASEMLDDMHALKSDKLSLEAFMLKYGHLRPGTYDILSQRYDQTDAFEVSVNEKDRKASFSHQNEIVEPHYYKVFLENINTNVEFTVTDRSSYFKIRFPKTKKANIIIDAFFKKSEIIILPDENKILGVAKNSSGGTPKNFANYFVIEFNQKFYDYGVWSGSGFKIF